MLRVPVLSPSGQSLMPAKASRVRRWLKEGKARVIRNDLGIFQVQLVEEPSGSQTQSIVVGVDPGKHSSGVGVQSAKATLFTAHLDLPFKTVTERMTQRRMMRRNRRYRKCRARPARFDNRIQGKLPPSIRANKQLELRIVKELLKLYPISTVVYEVVKARGDKGFTPVMVGQLQMLKWITGLCPTAVQEGWQTSKTRQYLGLEKNKANKSLQVPETHAVDGVSLAASQFVRYKSFHTANTHGYDWTGEVQVTPAPFAVVRRPPISRRQLHLMNAAKGAIRRKYGGSTTPFNIRKGDLVKYKDTTGYCSGYTGRALSVSDFNWKRLGRFAISKVELIARCTGLVVKLNPLAVIPRPTVGASLGRNTLAED